MIRAFVPDAREGALAVTGAVCHHLARVLRLRAGDAVELFDGRGHSFSARVVEVGAEAVRLEVGPGRAAPPSRPVAVVQGLPKADKLEWVLQKGTELGASAFFPVTTARSVVKLSGPGGAKQARWQRIVDEAARQCGRALVPRVEAPRALLEAARALAETHRLLVLDEEERGLGLAAAVADAPGPLALVVGPEGGLGRDEVAALAALGARPVTLGQRVLRTETAALAALAVVRHLDGELG